ncbi:MAG TPA: L-histidine N(alpha)-methyltransferase [Vicinamibacterales bacterium]|nr:L-histidine N(alpha)-methyltransferase [Vicinamibacterales bacterium]
MPPIPRYATKRFADAVAEGLSHMPRRLPPEFFYDALGSALFDAIGQLPWYPITRTESAMLHRHREEIAALAGEVPAIIELGPGNGTKLATLVGAYALQPRLDVHLVDVSPAALDAAAQTLSRDTRNVVVRTHLSMYEEGAREALALRPADGRMLTIFLGSNIGNFDRDAADDFLRELRRLHRAGDRLLLGADLVKSEADMLLAYDDPLGVTAAFNRNLLVRANREIGADFNIETFAHRAVWNEGQSRMEAYLVSTIRQRVRIPASSVEIVFEAGDTIWTESSHKYDPPGIAAMLARAGFGMLHQWIDNGFALTLGEAR